ncbi:DUF2516 family protein [Longispora albida]|uniref:DUF2516 family protein n=1 Tax=Longispora albida TaxID=203523 RepID=UPI00035C2E1A|nr:DUF2516 family protein [Longispora albida]
MFSIPVDGPWVFAVIAVIDYLIAIFALVISVAAFVHCVRQRADAFAAIGTLAKGPWTALLGGAVLVSLLSGLGGGGLGIFSILAITASAVYLLDVRPGLRDATNGHW